MGRRTRLWVKHPVSTGVEQAWRWWRVDQIWLQDLSQRIHHLAPLSQFLRKPEACALTERGEGQPTFGCPVGEWLWASHCLSLGLTVLHVKPGGWTRSQPPSSSDKLMILFILGQTGDVVGLREGLGRDDAPSFPKFTV